MMGDKLKPCPFCGGKAAIGHSASVYLDIRVYCKRCGAETGMYTSEIKAANAWNTRAERTCHNDSYRLDTSRFKCSECGKGGWWKDVADGQDKVPSFCPNCGAKVVEE